MNRFFTLLLAASCLTAVGQVTYPYNPDEDGNGQIAVGDLQGILATYGNAFSPSEILVDGETLTTVLTQLQNSIDSLSGLTGGGGSVLDMPLGTILPIATESVPEGWVLCDGRELAIEDYQGLYDLIGTTYGAGDSAFWAQVFYPATTFNIPDLRGRTIIGANDMGGEQSDVLTIHQASAGQIGGEETHQLTEQEMPSHSHDVPLSYGGGGQDFIFPVGSNWSPVGDSHPTSSAGGDQPHNNMQPYMALNFMMKVQAAENPTDALQASINDLSASLQQLAFNADTFYETFQGSASRTSSGVTMIELGEIQVELSGPVELEGMFDVFVATYTCGASIQLEITDDLGEAILIQSITGLSQTVYTCNAPGSSSGYKRGRFLAEADRTYSIVARYQVSSYNNYENQGGNSGSIEVAIFR